MTNVRELLENAANHAAAGAIDDALAAYAAALAQSPQLAEAHYNVATLRVKKGDLAGAEASLRETLRLRPDWPRAFLGLGHLYFRQGRFEAAEQAFDRAATFAPESVEALFNQAQALDRLRAWGEALPLLRRARALAPDNEGIWAALRSHLLLFQRHEEAFEDFRAFEPHAKVSARIVAAGLLSARIAAGSDYEDRYLPLALDWPYRAGEAGLAGVAVAQAQYFDVPRESLKRLYDAYNTLRQEERTGFADLAARPERKPGPLRIGYLSADFRDHVMGRLMRDVLSRHDRSRFAVYAYSLAVRETEDTVTEAFRACCEHFVRLDDIDNRAAAQAIAQDRLDVLIDLTGHSGSSRPGILLYKPAPVIVTHLGSHGAVGLQQVDFKLGDKHVDLPDAAQYQLEAPLLLDGCVLPLRRVAPAAAAPITREELGIGPDAVVFGTFVSLLKLSPRCLSLWRTILARVPGSLLAFSPRREANRALYLRRLASFGIGPSRVAFIPWTMDDATDRARYRLIDAVLDTLPYSGGDTTAAALDMGVPVVTRVGERAAERMSFSLLAHLGVTDTVAWTDDEYIAVACRLALDVPWRATIASAISARLPQSGLADLNRYTRSLETAYERAHELKLASES
ncbi:MAG TPA: tetratricopeptide repeat protein [Casimicrobiaceae bacterium]|nr:tetratricopeptide repeat protein [Casimicrobiaceae bacterium]